MPFIFRIVYNTIQYPTEVLVLAFRESYRRGSVESQHIRKASKQETQANAMNTMDLSFSVTISISQFSVFGFQQR